MLPLSPRPPETAGPVERVAIHPASPWWGEHRSRYRFALPHARDARVLDIACGTCFGVAMLADAGARSVYGADLAREAVAEAWRRHAGETRRFLTADGTRLPFPGAAFDLITSFETLEHVRAAAAFLAELRRVLAADGVLVLSTPNRAYTELNGQRCTNPFHVREYAPAELERLLAQYFGCVELTGQRLSPVYRISPFESDHLRFPATGAARLRRLWWKAQNKLPFTVKEGLSQVLTGRPFYPGEEHYLFAREGTETAPVLLAMCRP